LPCSELCAQGAAAADLDCYLDEFTFRFNRRRSRQRGLLFYRPIEGALAAQPRRSRAALTPTSVRSMAVNGADEPSSRTR